MLVTPAKNIVTPNGLPVRQGPSPEDLAMVRSVITNVKQARKDADVVIQGIKAGTLPTRETSLAVTKLQEAVMWLGMELKRINETFPELGLTNPYPNSKDPSNTKIEPTADGLKL